MILCICLIRFWQGTAMRGEDQRSERLFSYVALETRIPADHPLRAIRILTDEALAGLSRDFAKIYSRDGRPSIPPERLLRALLVQAFYTVRSERQLRSNPTSICCSAGLLDCRSTIRYGTPPCSARTETGCWTVTLRPSSL